MNKHQIAALASRLLGIYLIIHSLNYVSALALQLSMTRAASVQANVSFVYSLTSLCFVITLGIGLWLFFASDRAARIFVGHDDTSGEAPPVRAQNIQVIAFSIIGLYLTLLALPGFIKTTLSIWFSNAGWLYRSAISGQTYIDLVVEMLEIGIGGWLLFGASGVANLLNKLRGDLK
ncbi:MAG: hypothetical protein Q8P51_04205 [Ignavibacteria bacterium]|nr:hypothetical protein [Ignavibacteria bacterium]